MTASDSFQHGGGTIIPPDVALIILDCFETLVEMDERRYVARRGISAFLDRFAIRSAVPIVVLSDGEQAVVEAAVKEAGVAERIAAVVGAPASLATLPDGRTVKRLDAVIARFGADRERTVFIGDSPLDAEAAKFHRVPFVRVPRSEDRDFTFDRLISGPSRYQSSEFSSVFIDRYLQRRKVP